MLNSVESGFLDMRCEPATEHDLAVMFNGNMFTNATYLRASGYGGLLISEGDTCPPILWADQQSHFCTLDRMQTLSNLDIQRHAAHLFEHTHADFLVFNDIHLEEDSPAFSGYPSQTFQYKANWRRDISAGEMILPGKRASALRRKQKKLQEQVGDIPVEFRFERCRPGDVAAIVELNKAKIEAAGGRHHMTAEKQAAMEELCAEIGYTASLTCAEELIAGDIICVSGNRSFVPMLGHNPKYEKYSTGSQVTYLALLELEKMGCTESNFLWGDSRWKSDFRAIRDPLVTIVVRRNNRVLLSADYRKAVLPHAIEAAKAVLKPYLKTLRDKIRTPRLSLLGIDRS